MSTDVFEFLIGITFGKLMCVIVSAFLAHLLSHDDFEVVQERGLMILLGFVVLVLTSSCTCFWVEKCFNDSALEYNLKSSQLKLMRRKIYEQ